MVDKIDIDVIFTDKVCKTFSIEPRIIVKHFKEIVAQSIDLKDEIYFGFYFKDDRESNYWLCDNKSIISHEYFKGVTPNIVLHFVIKCFYEIQNVLSDDVVKYYMYHQLKYDIYLGYIECDSETCFQLLAMSLFIDGIIFENFQEDTKKLSIIPLYLFTRHPSVEHCICKIEKIYNELEATDDDSLMDRFIALIFQLPSQISHHFLAKDFNSSSVIIGINKRGFIECNQNTKSSYKLTYLWNEISNITSNKSRVNLDLQDPYNRSSLRRKSCANTISYGVINSHLAKSFVYLAKDTIDFISTYNHSPVSTIKSSQYKSEKRNMSYIKKFNSSSTRKGEKSRTPVSNLFMSETSIEMSRSPSRLSISSSTFNGSCHTNDSTSLQYDDDSLIGSLSLEELKIKYAELYSKKMELQDRLNEKVTKALELSKEEFTMTCKVPLDHKLLDPLGEVYFTRNPLPSHLLNPDNQSNYQSEKNRLLLQIETITNIYEVLRKTPKSEKKFKKELENKKKEIIVIRNQLNSLEKEHASDSGSFGNCRSNSVGNINRLSSILKDTCIHNVNSSVYENNLLEVKSIYNVPLTEPSQRRFKPSEKFQISTQQWNDETYPRIENDSKIKESIVPRFRITTSILKSNENSKPSNYYNNSNFQRFHSIRHIIKRPLSPENVISSFIKTQKSHSLTDQNNSSISSRSSIDDVTSFDFSDQTDCPIINVDNSEPKNRVVSLRHNSTVNNRVQTCRDSMEINHDRFNFSDSKCSRRIYSKSNLQKRQSTSLEDLREEEATTNIRYLSKRDEKESSEPIYTPYKTKVTYRPSIRDGNICNLIRGKQPSIILKQAKNNSLELS